MTGGRAAVLALMLCWAAGGRARGDEGAFLARLVVDGTINPAVADFIHEGIERAAREGALALVIELDTPGGLLTSARAIVKDILGASVPVVVYVSPSGAGAGSAGVFIVMAAHVAAMAPGTNIGAAHPVGGHGEDIPGKLGQKVERFTTSFGEELARQRGRNVRWVRRAVRHSAVLGADRAVRRRVVDLVARNLTDLVRRVDGRAVMIEGESRDLALAPVLVGDQVRVRDYEMRLAQRLVAYLADPNIAYLLMMLGTLGLYAELTHPGLGIPGIVGGIALLLGLAALQVLPLNVSGLGLIALGIGLLVAELFLPTFGIVGAGGLVAFLLGSLFLFDTGSGIMVAPGLVYGVGGTMAALMLIVAVLVVRTQRRPATGGEEGMLHATATVTEALDPVGMVRVRGEYWSAESGERVSVGEHVEVVEVSGLRLRVRPLRSG